MEKKRLSLVNCPIPVILTQQFLSTAPDGVPTKQKPILLDFGRKRMHGKETRKAKEGDREPSCGLWPAARAVAQPEPLVTRSSNLLRIPWFPLTLKPRTRFAASGLEMQLWSQTVWSLCLPLLFWSPHSWVTGLGWGIWVAQLKSPSTASGTVGASK